MKRPVHILECKQVMTFFLGRHCIFVRLDIFEISLITINNSGTDSLFSDTEFTTYSIYRHISKYFP
jgi:hypothetical protein